MWKVSETYAAGAYLYQVYRLIDPDAVDHSGNREVIYSTEDKQKAVAYAEVMNRT